MVYKTTKIVRFLWDNFRIGIIWIKQERKYKLSLLLFGKETCMAVITSFILWVGKKLVGLIPIGALTILFWKKLCNCIFRPKFKIKVCTQTLKFTKQDGKPAFLKYIGLLVKNKKSNKSYNLHLDAIKLNREILLSTDPNFIGLNHGEVGKYIEGTSKNSSF